MKDSQRGVPGDRAADMGRRDADRRVWADKQQQRRDRAHARSGVFGYGVLAGHRWADEDEEEED